MDLGYAFSSYGLEEFYINLNGETNIAGSRILSGTKNLKDVYLKTTSQISAPYIFGVEDSTTIKNLYLDDEFITVQGSSDSISQALSRCTNGANIFVKNYTNSPTYMGFISKSVNSLYYENVIFNSYLSYNGGGEGEIKNLVIKNPSFIQAGELYLIANQAENISIDGINQNVYLKISGIVGQSSISTQNITNINVANCNMYELLFSGINI